MAYTYTFALLSGNIPASYLDTNFSEACQRSNNLSDLTSASTARTNLGLGSMATQSASAVAITGGSITGLTTLSIADLGTLIPVNSDGAAIGSTTKMWSDLFLASGAVINFNNGNYTITHSAGNLAFAGGPLTAPSFIPSGSTIPSNGVYLPAANTLGFAVNSAGEVQITSTATSPVANDGNALGTTALMWSDLFLADGGVINWNNGDVTITHSLNTLTFGGAASGYVFDALINISGASAGQIQFPSTQNASANANTLDDYAEGTWTPVLTFVTPGNLSVSYSVQYGTYTKIGRLVTVDFNITTSAFTFTTASGNLRITGLPFACKTATGYNAIGALVWAGITKATYTAYAAQITSGLSEINLVSSGSGVALNAVDATYTPTAGTVILRGTICYEAAN